MIQSKFLRNKIDRQIKYNGSLFTFVRYGVDDYGQFTDEVIARFIFDGLFHETVKHVSLAESDEARIFDVPKSYILCLYEYGKEIKIDDHVVINEKEYRVTGKTDVNNFQVAFDISLEMVKDGEQN